MKCYNCGGEYVTQTGPLQINDACLGPVFINDVEQSKCQGCGDTLLSPDAAEKIGYALNEMLDSRIAAFPLKAFVSAAEACDILGISRQAFHKNCRIRRGFIFQTRHAGQDWYLRESVEKFKVNDDGRYPLFSQTRAVEYVAREKLQSDFQYPEGFPWSQRRVADKPQVTFRREGDRSLDMARYVKSDSVSLSSLGLEQSAVVSISSSPLATSTKMDAKSQRRFVSLSSIGTA